jgi:Protein of unknown function (DUF2934)
MARKTTSTTTTNSRKKTQVPASPGTAQVTPGVHLDVREQVRVQEVRKDIAKHGTPSNYVPVDLASAEIEEQIRLRAYELYLQRRATAGGATGDQNQDWLVAEREIRSAQGGHKFGIAAGGAQA